MHLCVCIVTQQIFNNILNDIYNKMEGDFQNLIIIPHWCKKRL